MWEGTLGFLENISLGRVVIVGEFAERDSKGTHSGFRDPYRQVNALERDGHHLILLG